MQNVHLIAETLGKFEYEVLALSPDEFARHLAYLKMKGEKQQKESKRSRSKTRTVNKRRK